METILTLISDYGLWVYGILFLYCGLKSGALPLFAGFVAQQGALDWSIVIAVSLLGGYLGDELRFHWARRYGKAALTNRPRLTRLVEKGNRVFERYGPLYIFLYRYPKGMRTIGALPIGFGNMPWQTFTLYNAASALLWATLLVGGGYLIGDAFADYISDNWSFFSLATLAVFALLAIFAWYCANRVFARSYQS